MAEMSKNEMQTSIAQLRQACDELEGQVAELDREVEEIESKNDDDMKREQKAHADQVEYLSALNEDYKKELEQLLSTNPGGEAKKK